MTKTKRMTTTRKTKSPRLSENPTNVDFEDGITDVKRTPSDVRPGCSRASGAVKRREFLPALELQDTIGDPNDLALREKRITAIGVCHQQANHVSR
jgi:hypothetical protein